VTLLAHLTSLLPLFFPPNLSPLAYPLVHGIVVPLEAELGWLGSCLAGVDGWVCVVLVLEGR
jgi:autophagy-related protein 5